MRKTKENISLNASKTARKSEALETEREERYEEVGGETATEGVGRGYTTEPELERSMESSDGPMSGESLEPPKSQTDIHGNARTKRRRLRKGTEKHGKMVGRHAAARSSKTI